jgi:uncharacterized protein YaiE (UPF0345 family)
MLPGEYEFSTREKEMMEIFSGELEVLLPGETLWKTVRGGCPLRLLPTQHSD